MLGVNAHDVHTLKIVLTSVTGFIVFILRSSRCDLNVVDAGVNLDEFYLFRTELVSDM